ncbi:spaetzle-processing enzyme-like [Drosophila busckii]|uniref:spaetzle-processing enzyme-like n=1 Tax=Drosophila busckii TaxID=30019 RepID=UPI00083EEB8D|nr:spaetzle-processing enzyme-like [Drosophila busckii]
MYHWIWFMVCATGLSLVTATPLIHYGHCMVNTELGVCQPRQLCWELQQEANFNSQRRSRCHSRVRDDLVCCRRAQKVSASSAALYDVLPQTPVCGGYDGMFEDRIIAGTQAHILDYPWTALLLYSSDGLEFSHMCGGSLIHERWVLTAAHCVPSSERSDQLLQVRLGEWNTSSSIDCQQFMNDRICAPPHLDIPIDRIIVHEQFHLGGSAMTNNSNDIALLRLKQPVSFSDFVLPICLPAANLQAEHQYEDYAMEVTGWGNTEQIRFGGSSIKLKAMLNAVSMARCRQIYAQLAVGQLCAGGDSQAGTCGGDSGGPLMLVGDNAQGKRSYYLTGIVSLGQASCINGGRPMIFTRVEYYVPWITGTIQANS